MPEKRDLQRTHPLLHCLAGGVGGTVGTILSSPLEVIKVRLQGSVLAPHEKRLGLVHLMRNVILKEGVVGLFKGMVPTLVGVLPSRCIFFFNYQICKGYYVEYFDDRNAMYFMSAISSSLVTSTATSPIWVVKTRMQLDESQFRKQRLTTMRCIREVYQESGIKGFYRGLSASYLGSLDTAANFAIYEFLKRHLLAWHRGIGSESGVDQEFNPLRSQLRSQSEAALTIAASFISKLSAVVISYPHEVLRTRLREPGNKYQGLLNTFNLVYMEEGLYGLYAGIGTHCVRVIPVTCATLATYELVVYLLQDVT